MKQKRTIISLFLCFLFASIQAQEKFYTQIFDDNIKTIEIKLDGENLSDPILFLNENAVLKFSFDELSHNVKNYSYKITHCDANWTESNISEFEYLEGSNLIDINDYQQSVNTTFDYTHYTFSFPNESVKPKISGNYVISVFESSNPTKIRLRARFCIAEQLIDIQGKVRANTDIDNQEKHQQVDFDVITKNYKISDPFSEIKICIKQNNRTDNEVTNIKPTFLSNNKLSYSNNEKCIFEAGNEYRPLDISNIHLLGDNVEKILFVDPNYHVSLINEKTRTKNYSYYKDIDGKFVVNLQKSNYDNELEADYMYVHFSLAFDAPFFDGGIFVAGGFNSQLLNEKSRMKYNNESQAYTETLLLKQGVYNYLYLFVPKGETKGTTEKTDGNFWETENEYEIFVYHQPPNERYDKLIGYKKIKIN